MRFIGIDTEIEWISLIEETPAIGHIFTLAFIFIPPVIISFIVSYLIPTLHSDIGFTKIILLLLPCWNLSTWLLKIKAYIFFLPAWIFLGIVAIIKVVTHNY